MGEESLEVPKHLAADAGTAVIAGSDTTATAASHLWYFLLRHPRCWEILAQEVETVFPDGEEPFDFYRLAQMPYLNACM